MMTPHPTRISWFLAFNGCSMENQNQAKAAVLSSQPYAMDRYCLYDGEDLPFIEWLENHQVRVFRHRFTLSEQLLSAGKPLLQTGAFLRVDIPEIIWRHGLPIRHYLYTDCDILFQKDPNALLNRGPESICAAPEHNQHGADYFNAGILWCNATSLLDTLAEFREFLLERNFDFKAADQTALNEFYHDFEWLPATWNWKPYWGINDDAFIIHFHGPKPHHHRASQWPKALDYFLNPITQPFFEHYVNAFEQQLARA